MLHPSTKAKIDQWIEEAPEFRRVESEPLAQDAWESKALEDGQVVYEEVELDTDEPTLYKLAAWCERQVKIAPRPPVKASAPPPSAARAATRR
ncbi:MAG TPA: hypothetical protein VER11_09535 [Polyangiaceae bacterium]|nr:hypothetical protein [Polyangiaceae bacterium]